MEARSNSQKGSKIMVPHCWNFLETRPPGASGNTPPRTSGGHLQEEVSYQRPADGSLPERGLREAAGQRARLDTPPCSSRAPERLWEGPSLLLEQPPAQQEPPGLATQNREANISPCNVSGTLYRQTSVTSATRKKLQESFS